MRAAAIGLCALVLAGCAPTFTRAGVSAEQQARDEFECAQASTFWSTHGELVSYPQMRRCMGAKGYR